MVPFYGQGMNAGLEDVRVLFDFLDQHGVYDPTVSSDSASRAEARAKALTDYTMQRTPDASAINDLALRNYTEMRASVKSPLYRLRKWIEESVNKYVPSLGWSTQYSRVSFENERYSEVEKAVQRQGRILTVVVGLSLAALAGVGGTTLWRWQHARPSGRWLTKWLLKAAKKTEEFAR